MNQYCSMEIAVILCKELYYLLDSKGYPALTGGVLYKDGPRKDIDIVIYPTAQTENEYLFWYDFLVALTKVSFFYDERRWFIQLKNHPADPSFVVKAKLCAHEHDDFYKVDFLMCAPIFGKEYEKIEEGIIDVERN